MKEKKNQFSATEIPDLSGSIRNVIHSEDELQYGLRGVVRILSHRRGKTGYFFEGFHVLFASELNENIEHEETYLDYENLKIIIKLPDPKDPANREIIRHQYTRQYTLGADDLKTRAALVAFSGLDELTKKALVESEKKLENKNEN